MKTKLLFVSLVLVLSVVMLYPVDSCAVKYELVQFDPGWQPPAGVFSGGRSQATGMILSHIRSNFSFAGTTIQVVTQLGATNAGDQVNTIRYIGSNSTSYISGRLGRPYTSAAWGCNFGGSPGTGFVFGSEFNSDPDASNNSAGYARAAGATGAHEAGHGLNATHTTGGSDKMKVGSTGAEKANTERNFTPANRARMISAVRAGTAAPKTKGKESVTLVYSHDRLDLDPTRKLEDRLGMLVWTYIPADFESWDFGYITHTGDFLLLLEGGAPEGVVEMRAGTSYDFAIRSRLDPTQVFPLSDWGASLPAGIAQNPDDAIYPVVTEPYTNQMFLDFNTPMGALHLELMAEGTNGFYKEPEQIPTLQHWGMILLLLVLMGFAIYRIRMRAIRVTG